MTLIRYFMLYLDRQVDNSSELEPFQVVRIRTRVSFSYKERIKEYLL